MPQPILVGVKFILLYPPFEDQRSYKKIYSVGIIENTDYLNIKTNVIGSM
jgi:hypothetical protein